MSYELKDQYHYFGASLPYVKRHFDWKILRRTIWTVSKRDGNLGLFTSWWICNRIQFYHGDAKCDGAETYAAKQTVMVDKPSELKALRYRSAGPGEISFDNMGGA